MTAREAHESKRRRSHAPEGPKSAARTAARLAKKHSIPDPQTGTTPSFSQIRGRADALSGLSCARVPHRSTRPALDSTGNATMTQPLQPVEDGQRARAWWGKVLPPFRYQRRIQVPTAPYRQYVFPTVHPACVVLREARRRRHSTVTIPPANAGSYSGHAPGIVAPIPKC